MLSLSSLFEKMVRYFKFNKLESDRRKIILDFADLSDLKFIKEMMDRGATEKHFYGNKNFSNSKLKNIIQRKIEGHYFFVFKLDDTKIGFAYSFINILYYASEINMLYILEEYRKNGLASQFIDFFENTYRKYNLPFIVRCDKDNSKDAIRLFKSAGYIEQPKLEKTSKYTFVVLKKEI